MKDGLLFQDNKSEMLLHVNHQFSIGNGTKHINFRFFFVVDKIKKKEVKIMCCPTEDMVVDCNRKPTQGRFFVRQRNNIQGIKPKYFKMCKA